MNISPAEYPSAKAEWLADHSYPGRADFSDKTLVVNHVTEGSTADGAINTFRTSARPNRTSVTFVIDRDGTVYQLLPLSDWGFHASAVNPHSWGIEHVGITGPGAADLTKRHGIKIPPLPCTEAQYQASAKLNAWLCQKMKRPIDRKTILMHSEASPQDHHDLCCSGALNLDRVVHMAQQILGGK